MKHAALLLTILLLVGCAPSIAAPERIPPAIQILCEQNQVWLYHDITSNTYLYGISSGPGFVGNTTYYDENGRMVGVARWSDEAQFKLETGELAHCIFEERNCPSSVKRICP